MAFNENAERDRERRSAEEVKRFPCLRRGVLYKPIEGINARRRGFKFHAARRDYSFPRINSPKKNSPERGGRACPSLLRWRESPRWINEHYYTGSSFYSLSPPTFSVRHTARVIQRLLQTPMYDISTDVSRGIRTFIVKKTTHDQGKGDRSNTHDVLGHQLEGCGIQLCNDHHPHSVVRRAPFHFRGAETALNTGVEPRTDAVRFSLAMDPSDQVTSTR